MRASTIVGVIALGLILAVAFAIVFPWEYLTGFIPSGANDSEIINAIRLPDGFSIDVYARVAGARSLVLSESGTLFVGTRGDKVYAVTQTGDVIKVARNLNSPNGVALKGGDLYVAEISRIIRFNDIENNLASSDYEVVFDGYPKNALHGWKYIAFGPDGLLYVPVGAPCNICSPEEPYATITRLNVSDPAGFEIIAWGVRNTVGFDWNPTTNTLWFTDNGRDWLGNNAPPDELNAISKQRPHFGYPYCHGGTIQDPKFDLFDCSAFEQPARALGPHVAALGMTFYTGTQFPSTYHGDVFIAEHGSWNRDAPIGYRIMRVSVENNKAQSYEVFAEGWLKNSVALGRPVDVIVTPFGSLLVSDDKAGLIYEIGYGSVLGTLPFSII
ncbi:sorbosone dehydrogenase [archaeon CG10_big_fil_rev_8_21_14_0_10_43_11]|nr:MAG: sorbosone dehydrogenase [archaeon CG10_big_fil_rev_8_21_14_0_10_43_11]